VLFKAIDKIKIHEDRIYILDRKLKKLVVFDRTGNGIGQVGQPGQGPEEYLHIADFDVAPSGHIYFIDGVSDKLFLFDPHLDFVSVRNMPFGADLIKCISDEKLMFGLCSWNKGKNASDKIVVTDPDMNVLEAYLTYDEFVDEAYWISFYEFAGTDERIYYNKPVDNLVHEFSKEGKYIKSYNFDFGKKNVVDKYKKDIEGNLDKFENFCCLKNFVVMKDEYIMGTVWDETKTKNFLIDKNKHCIYLSDELPDSDISNLAGIYKNTIISFIYPGKYDDIESLDVPSDIKEHLENENFVLYLTELN
ncbi:MAG: 6-bladed beta-propeller, partial [Bacteroidales bacterium]|nr:6-bladed beta-propeller [Bacteroidales bacterium]